MPRGTPLSNQGREHTEHAISPQHVTSRSKTRRTCARNHSDLHLHHRIDLSKRMCNTNTSNLNEPERDDSTAVVV